MSTKPPSPPQARLHLASRDALFIRSLAARRDTRLAAARSRASALRSLRSPPGTASRGPGTAETRLPLVGRPVESADARSLAIGVLSSALGGRSVAVRGPFDPAPPGTATVWSEPQLKTNWAIAAARIRKRRMTIAIVVPGLMSLLPSVSSTAPPSGTRVTPLPACRPERGGGRLPVERERQQAVGVDQQHQLRRLGVGVGVDPARGADLAGRAAPRRAPPARAPPAPELVGVDVELAVAEPVDPPHLADDGAVVADLGQRHQSGHEPRRVDRAARARRAGRRPRGGRPRAPGCRARRRSGPGRGQVVLGVVERHDGPGAAGHRHRRCEQAVVGPEQHAARRPRRRPAGGRCPRRGRPPRRRRSRRGGTAPRARAAARRRARRAAGISWLDVEDARRRARARA